MPSSFESLADAHAFVLRHVQHVGRLEGALATAVRNNRAMRHQLKEQTAASQALAQRVVELEQRLSQLAGQCAALTAAVKPVSPRAQRALGQPVSATRLSSNTPSTPRTSPASVTSHRIPTSPLALPSTSPSPVASEASSATSPTPGNSATRRPPFADTDSSQEHAGLSPTESPRSSIPSPAVPAVASPTRPSSRGDGSPPSDGLRAATGVRFASDVPLQQDDVAASTRLVLAQAMQRFMFAQFSDEQCNTVRPPRFRCFVSPAAVS